MTGGVIPERVVANGSVSISGSIVIKGLPTKRSVLLAGGDGAKRITSIRGIARGFRASGFHRFFGLSRGHALDLFIDRA